MFSRPVSFEINKQDYIFWKRFVSHFVDASDSISIVVFSQRLFLDLLHY